MRIPHSPGSAVNDSAGDCLTSGAGALASALGSASGQLAEHWLLAPVTGDRYLICSDGLFSELPDDVILPLLAASVPQQAADALVAAACDAGGHDNVTVVVVDIDAGDAAADEATLVHDTLPLGVRPGEGW